MAALAALGALAAATSASSSGAPAIYMFKVSVQAVSSYDGKLHDPWYPPISRSTYGCTPVVAASATLTFSRPPGKGAGPDFLFMRGRIPGVLPGDKQMQEPAVETLRATNTPGQPLDPSTGCSPTQPPSDCGTKARPVEQTSGAVGMNYYAGTARQFFSVGGEIGSQARPPFRYCYIDPQGLDAGAQLKGAAARAVFAKLMNPRLTHFTLGGSAPNPYGSVGGRTFRWSATFMRIRSCAYPPGVFHDACLRGLGR